MIASMLLAVTLGQYTPQEAQALFVEANDAYYKGDYTTAQAKYEKLLETGQTGPDVLFNLGTTHLAKAELGPAVLYLERARRLASDDDIEANLAIARQKQVDQVVGEETAAPFTQRLAEAMQEPLISTLFVAACWLTVALFWWWRVTRPSLPLALAFSLLALATVSCGSAVAIHAWVRHAVVEAVVMAPTVKVLEFPGETAKTSFEIHAGLKVRLMESSGKFARIRLPNALEGWVDAASFSEI